MANNESRALIALLFFIYRPREKGAKEGWGGRETAAFTSDKIPANLSTLQPQRQNSSVEIGDRGVAYGGRGVMEGGGGGWTVGGDADAADELVQKRQEAHGVVRQFYALPVTKTIYA